MALEKECLLGPVERSLHAGDKREGNVYLHNWGLLLINKPSIISLIMPIPFHMVE